MIKTNSIQLTTEEIRTIWDYKDGELWWKERKQGRQMDRPAGSFDANGYRQIQLNGRFYRLHRLVWRWHHRTLIDGYIIDHIDNNPANNRIENLQQISQAGNVCRSERVKNPKGCVSFHTQRQKWRVTLTRDYKSMHLGYFATHKEGVEYLENYHDEQARSDCRTGDGARGETSQAL